MGEELVGEGMRAQLERRRETLKRGARRIGWKIGFNVRPPQEKLGLDGPVVGYLTSDTEVAAGSTWSLAAGPVVVECEVAVELGEDARSIAAVLPALELAAPPDLDQDVATILAGNVFHRAVAFGPRADTASPGPARILVNGEEQAALDAEGTGAHLEERVRLTVERLDAAGESLEPGDRIITGVLAPPHAAAPGDVVRLELEAAGAVELRFAD
jgi:2-keto-4-pentenoate hydratase